jgi:esterase/lipase
MTRLWIPGWQMKQHCFDAVKQALNANHEPTLSYEDSRLGLRQWLNNANKAIIKPTEIVGWSLGGALAYLLASENKLIKKVWLINTNVKFSGEQGLPADVAENFMSRYQHNSSATKKRFAMLVDSQRAKDISAYLLEGDHHKSLQWLYDFNANDHQVEAACHILLSQQDQLVPHEKAKQAWQINSAASINTINAQHSSPIFESAQIAQWMQHNG